MKTYDIRNEKGELFAFEIENSFTGPRKIKRLLLNEKGYKILNTKTHECNRLELEYLGNKYRVHEDWCDSSRYWIGPEDLENVTAQIQDIKRVFDEYKPFPINIIIAITDTVMFFLRIFRIR